MRIPLDYYRILGLPIQATAEQLKQAHRDRTMQLPRREYSDVAIESRKRLIDEAYGVLADGDQRQAYDMGFLAKTYETEDPKTSAPVRTTVSKSLTKGSANDTHTPSVEIDDKDFVGALLVLQELGEYEQVVKLSLPYLSNGSIGIKDGRFGDPDLILPDVILTVALAYLELGREQWQQGQYEKAAESLETGQEILLKENLFASLRGEMQADLYKLRPYRILELLQQPAEKVAERRRGMQLLREMLHERGGIDGHGDDQSGLSVEDFLRFVQQLRRYLTTTEQQNIFETEARRPSAVATYLAVYAEIAQGFANRQPALIRKAKLMLMQLGRRQDVHLEKAVCSLLLGQTEEASRALELSQEREPIAYIRENSKDSPDLLPGLCLYAERWLQDEVFPHFRDLINHSVSLKDYFADEHVQSYLESLSSEVGTANEWVVVQPRRHNSTGTGTTQKPMLGSQSQSVKTPTSNFGGNSPGTGAVTLTSSMAASSSPAPTVSSASPPRATTLKTELSSTPVSEPELSQASRQPPPRLSEPLTSSSKPPESGSTRSSSSKGSPSLLGQESSTERRSTSTRRQQSSKFDPATLRRLLLLGAASILGLWLAWLILSAFWGLVSRAFGSGNQQPMVQLDRPPVAIPTPEPANPLTEDLSPEVAQQVVQKWLDTKAAALGPEHQIEALREILVDPALAQWVSIAQSLESENSYRNYQHNLTINDVQIDSNDPNQAVIDAQVSETTQFYQNGQRVDSRSDNLRVRYQLVRQDDLWQIEDWRLVR
ncbi:MAG: IMS domain-containing protein [Lyngbya sp.]|nr:IMS domain-containing protein [Lyngbya sp.]